MSFFIIIQARLTSTRLPKKVMLPLCETTVLEVLLTRLDKFKKNIIIATTHDADQIVNICKTAGLKYFQGSTENVLERYFHAAKEHGAKDDDLIIRITSDCPFHDSDIVQKVIDLHHNYVEGYTYVDINSSYPRGFDTEVFSFKLLKDAYENATENFDKEHVTPYIKRQSVKISALKDDHNNSHYRLTLDTKEDYEFTKELYKKLNDDLSTSYKEIIQTLKDYPELSLINADVQQKTT